ncbi:hypothetical protein QIS99_28275 [Streptomyces sp. B-S-A8]|uniref:TrbL/VirB6 plasmid conjugal transfer protein n=1 Tax=Streptomyces solicavernae TaxID=3043614 RepID=A0ABT6S047_9ACTN|nr:hypothetical protein [Streptomyces sp. B-S-A8]MDI3390059.1 hypothetical protein [Streptomyces sp. B-S-A8]
MSPAAFSRWRTAVTLIVLTALVTAAASTPAFAADGDPSGGLLDPLNVESSEGVPLDRYELTSFGDGPVESVKAFMITGSFALSRTITGLGSWLVDWAYRFPVLDKLAGPAQKISDAYERDVVGPLGLVGVFTAWAFVFGLVLIMRGRVARGAGEIMLTLVIGALAATTTVKPTVLLGYDGPIQQTQRVALEAASITSNGGDKAKGADPCDLITGPAQQACRQTPPANDPAAAEAQKKKRQKACDTIAGPARDTCLSGERPLAAADVSRPITRTLTETLVVQPYMLLQYGQHLDKDDPLYKTHKKLIDPKKPNTDHCDRAPGPAGDLCRDMASQTYPQAEFEKKGAEGKAIAAYMTSNSWERVFGALLVLLTTSIVFIVILAMVLAQFAAQLACAAAAACTLVVLAWALLPGPNRAALWKWVGIYASAMLLLVGVCLIIPLFGVAAAALLKDNSTPMMERLLTLVGLAVTLLAAHRIMLRKGQTLGQRIAARMRYARIGGSHTMGEHSAATAAAFSSLNHGAGGGMGGSPAHLSFMSRHSALTSGLRALNDPTGLPGHPAALLSEAHAEGRRALAPLALTARAAHSVLIGPRQPKAGPPRGGRTHSTVIDGRTGRITHDAQGDEFRPIGARLEAGLKRTRAGRVMVGTGKAAYYSTVGLPATWTRARRAASAHTHDLRQQLDRQRSHYRQVTDRWTSDSRDGLRDLTTPARRTYEAVSQPLERANRLHTWDQTWLDEHGTPRYANAGMRENGDARVRRFSPLLEAQLTRRGNRTRGEDQ